MSAAEEAAVRDRFEGLFEAFWTTEFGHIDMPELKDLAFKVAFHHYVKGIRDGLKQCTDATN